MLFAELMSNSWTPGSYGAKGAKVVQSALVVEAPRKVRLRRANRARNRSLCLGSTFSAFWTTPGILLTGNRSFFTERDDLIPYRVSLCQYSDKESSSHQEKHQHPHTGNRL